MRRPGGGSSGGALPQTPEQKYRLFYLSAQVYPLAHNAANTAPGDMGSRVIRTPIALWMALAIAAIGGTRGTSPAPRTPKGWPGLGTSTITVSIIGRSKLVGMR